jgi:sugar lactone lactonase YvrE
MPKTCGAGFHPAGRFSIGLLLLNKNVRHVRPRANAWGSVGLVLGLAACLTAGETKSWQQGEYADFEKGTLKNLSLRSDGLVSLAPQFREVFDSSSAYLWAMAHDSAGNLYAGGGPDAKLYRISPSGEKKTLATFDALEVHAIAIDRKDQVFAATDPDGKVYKVSAAGKAEVFYDPKTKYIWALAFNSKGDLFVATGDQGEIHRVTPDGKGSVFFRSEETHARSLAIDKQDNVIVGTDPGGLVIRISPAGEGFVLYQMPKKEVTAVALAKDGSIYASGVGSKPTPSSLPPPQIQITAPPPSPSAGGAAAVVVQRPPSPPPATLSPSSSSVSGGSDIYQIHPDGHPQKVWTHAQDIVYALGFDAQGRVLAGAGNKGAIYRLDTDNLYTVLLNASPTQVTGFCAGKDGKLYVATGNAGKVFEIGASLEREGSIESEVFDAGLFSYWGRLTFTAELHSGRVALVTRSGNLDRPMQNWSPWSSMITSPEGARITSPPARFLQWKATLNAAGNVSPELESVEAAYLPKNVAPKIGGIEITPANYKFPAPSAPSSTPSTLSLPAMGKSARTASSSSSESSTTTPSMTYAKGQIGARWIASDENGDTLIYTVHIRGVKETGWKLLRDKVREKYLSWDSTAYPDGEYRVRITASDLPGNPPEQALSSELTSEVFLLDNTPPRISGLTATRNGAKLSVRWKALDALSVIAKAEYSVDGGEWLVTAPTTKLSDSRELDYDLSLDNISPGEHTIAVRVQDEYDNQSSDKTVVR